MTSSEQAPGTSSSAGPLTRAEMLELLSRWNVAWADYDLDAVMDLFHDDVVFEHWTGSVVRGKAALRDAWSAWFASPAGFRFVEEDLVADEGSQTALYRWTLEWPSRERGWEGHREARRGVDVLRFEDRKLIEKLTYSKTSLAIDGRPIRLGVRTD